MFYPKIVGGHRGGIHHLMSLILLLTCLTSSSSAAFSAISSLSLADSPRIWRGIPEVTIELSDQDYKYCQICVDDTYWNSGIADEICKYHGFEGSMVIKDNTTPSEPDFFLDGYAVCNRIENSNLPLECEFRESCDRVPTISCIIPGYIGCYTETASNPFFSDGVEPNITAQSPDIRICTLACASSPYLGLTKGQECICGSTLGDRSLEGDCDLGCQEDDLQICGGSNSISVYNANLLGRCKSEPRDLISDEPLFITSPGFPDMAVGSCTWSVSIDVQALHNLHVLMIAVLNSYERITMKSKDFNEIYRGGNTRANIFRAPYNYQQDTITVTYDHYLVFPQSTNFIIRFSLEANPMYTSAPGDMTTTKSEPTSRPGTRTTDEPTTMKSGATSGPDTSVPDKLTTTRIEPTRGPGAITPDELTTIKSGATSGPDTSVPDKLTTTRIEPTRGPGTRTPDELTTIKSGATSGPDTSVPDKLTTTRSEPTSGPGTRTPDELTTIKSGATSGPDTSVPDKLTTTWSEPTSGPGTRTLDELTTIKSGETRGPYERTEPIVDSTTSRAGHTPKSVLGILIGMVVASLVSV